MKFKMDLQIIIRMRRLTIVNTPERVAKAKLFVRCLFAVKITARSAPGDVLKLQFIPSDFKT